MNCHQCKKNLSAYLDGELDASFAGQVAQHAQFCASCGRELDELRRLVAATEAMPRQQLPDDFLAGVRIKIAQGSQADKVNRSIHMPSVRPSRLSWFRELFLPEWNWQRIPAAAVVLLIVVGISAIFIMSPSLHAPKTVALRQKFAGSASVPASSANQPLGLEAQVKEKEASGTIKTGSLEETNLPGAPGPRSPDKIPNKKPAETEFALNKKIDFGKGEEVSELQNKALSEPPPPSVASPPSSIPRRESKVAAVQQKKDSVSGSSTGEEASDYLRFQAQAPAQSPADLKHQAMRFYACSTNDVAAAQAAILKILDRCGGQLVDFVPAVKWMDVTVLRAQVPTQEVPMYVQELIKFGGVRILSPPVSRMATTAAKSSAQNPQKLVESGPIATHGGWSAPALGLADRDKIKKEEQRADEAVPGGKSVGSPKDATFTFVEIQLQRPLTMKAKQVPSQTTPSNLPTKKAL